MSNETNVVTNPIGLQPTCVDGERSFSMQTE